MIAHKDFDGSRGPGSDRGNAAEIAEEQTETSAPKRSPRFHEIYNNLIAISRQCPRGPFFPTEWGTKKPAPGWKWRQRHINKDHELVQSLQNDHGIGMDFTGTGLVAIDCDTDASYPIFIKIFGKHPDEFQTPQWTSWSKIDGTEEIKRQILFALPSGLAQARITFSGNAIDVRGDGCYSVMPTNSPHPKTGRPYFWLKEPTKYAIAQITEEQLEHFRVAAGESKSHRTSRTDGAGGTEKPEWDEINRARADRWEQFKSGRLPAKELRPGEYADFVLTQYANWQKIAGHGSRFGWQKEGPDYVTSAAEYRDTTGGRSIKVQPNRIAEDMILYHPRDWGEGKTMTMIDLVLRRSGVAEPTFVQKVNCVNEIAGAVGAPKYQPQWDGNEFTDEEKQQWRQEKVRRATEENRRYNEIDCEIVEVSTMAEAAEIVKRNPDRPPLVNGPKGSGKSEVVFELKRDEIDLTLLTISPTRGLAMEQSRKYATPDYKAVNAIQNAPLTGLSITCDSLHRVPEQNPQWEPGYTIADECDSLFNHINTSTTDIRNHRPESRAAFEEFMREGNPVLMSADIGGAEVKYVRAVTRKEPLVIKVKIPPRGSDLWTIHGFANTMAHAMGWLQQAVQEWINSGKEGYAPTITIFSDSRAAADRAANLLSGSNYVVDHYGDREEQELAARMKGDRVDELITPEVRSVLDVRKITKETVNDQKEMMSDPTAKMIAISNSGRVPVSIASPSVAQGNSYVYPGEHIEIYLLTGGTLDVRGLAQHAKRDRNPDRVIIGDMRSNTVPPIVQTMEEIREEMIQAKNVQLEDRDFVDAVRRNANYMALRDHYYKSVGSSIDKATKSEVMENVTILMELSPETITNQMVADFLMEWDNQSAWAAYQIFRMQERQLGRQDELTNLIQHLVEHDGFRYMGEIDAEADKPLKEMDSVLDTIDDRMKASWIEQGHRDADQYGSEESIKDSLSSDTNLNPKEVQQHTGALMKHEFPGISFSEEQCLLETSSTPPTAAAKKLTAARNPQIGKKRMSKRTAARLLATGRKPEIMDNHLNRLNQLWAETLHQVGYMELLAHPRIQDSDNGLCNEDPAIVEFIGRCRKKQRTFAKYFNMRVPKKGAYEKYMAFVNRIHRKMGLTTRVARCRRLAQFHGDEHTSLQSHYIPNLGWAMELAIAHEQYWVGKEAEYISKVNRARQVAQYLRSGQAAADLERILIKKKESREAEMQAQQQLPPTESSEQLSIFQQDVSSAKNPEGCPRQWAIGAKLTVIAACSDFWQETVTLIDWRYSKDFDIWSAIVQTAAGVIKHISHDWLALA